MSEIKIPALFVCTALAHQFAAETMNDTTAWPDWVLASYEGGDLIFLDECGQTPFLLHYDESTRRLHSNIGGYINKINAGDWIVRDVFGIVRIIPDKSFRDMFKEG